MNKVHVIVNPFSARGKTGERWDIIKDIIRHYFNEFKYVMTEKPRQATEIARGLLKDGYDLIIGVGGDGTLNEITNGFFKHDSHQSINEDASLGIIPSGTGSDFGRFLKIPSDFKKSVALIKNGTEKQVDVGKVTFTGANGEKTGRYFINVSDFGLGAEVVKKLSDIPSGKKGALSYYKGLLSTIRTYNARDVKIIIDDDEVIEGRFLIGAVANGRIFGGGMIIAPQASPDDGYFDLVLVQDMKKFEIILNSRHLYTGKIDQHPKVTVKHAKNIKVFPIPYTPGVQSNVNIEYDGEIASAIPAEFEIIEKCLNFRI
ncbi:MAG: diacylglycerol kinase family lipid kinase [Acidobacteria bacterium]|jgi:YegS/Rv2252/BmrU family lipid kinase|nr:diacylglycerol kinase family lipid kinase [Acidobacteriota bacterium]